MEDDFRVIISARNERKGSKGATGLRDLFREDIEELGSPDPDWFARHVGEVPSVTVDNQKNILGSDESSSHSSSSIDEDGISSSVRNLLKLLVKRASTQPGGEQDGLETSYDEDKTIEVDESWSSSMATPSKNRSMFNENNQSLAADFNLEISKLEDGNASFEGDSPIGRLTYSGQERESPKSDFVFFGFEDSLVDTRIKTHNAEGGQNVGHFDRESLSSYFRHSVESSFFLNFLISSINKSAEVKLVEAVKTVGDELLESLCFVVPSYFADSNGGESSELAGVNIGSSDNLKSCQKPVCSPTKQSYFNDLQTSKDFDAASISSGQKNIDVSSTANFQDCLKESLIEMAGNDVDVVKDQVEPGDANDVCGFRKHGENTNNVALCGLKKRCVELSDSRNSEDEPEYVTQILNLLCSPINPSNSNDVQRKRKEDGIREKEIRNTDRKEESEYIVKGLLGEIVEKSLNRLGDVKFNSPAARHAVFNEKSSSQNCVIEKKVNNSLNKKYVNEVNELERVKYEENSLEILDENVQNELINISFHSEVVQWNDVCSSSEKVNEGPFSPKSMKSNNEDQNSVVAATYSRTTTELNRHMKVFAPDATSANDGPLNSFADTKKSLHSPISELEKVPSDPQPILMDSIGTKLDPENETELNYLGSEDFLSCSVLEEVCQASEALAYIGKMKSDSLMGQEMNNGFKSPEVNSNLSREKVEKGRSQMPASSNRRKGNVSQGKTVGAYASSWKNEPSTSRNSLPPHRAGKCDDECSADHVKDFPGVEKHSSHHEEKERPGKSVKKKIIFNIPECSGLREFENELNADESLYHGLIRESQGKCESLILPVSDKVNISSSEAGQCMKTIACGDPKRFIYPKQRSQTGPMVPKEVLPEDLMCRVALLEKYSNILPNSGKSNLASFKMGTLASFSSLEPDECSYSCDAESKVMNNKKENIPSECQLFLKKDASFKVIEDCDAHGEIQANMLEHNRALGSTKLLIDETERLEKIVVNIQGTDSFDVVTELKLTGDTEKEELKPLSAIEECFLPVEACGNEQNMQINERGEVCTSPILTKKFRTKKPFRRRNKNRLNLCTPKTKTELDQGKEKLNPDSVLSEEAVSSIEHNKGNRNIHFRDNSQIVPEKVSDRNHISGMEKMCEFDWKSQKCDLNINKVLHLEVSSDGVESELEGTVRDKKDIPSKILNAKRFCSEESATVASAASNDRYSSVSDEIEAISKITLNDTLFSEDFYTSNARNDIYISPVSLVEADGATKKRFKASVSTNESIPSRDKLLGISAASGKKTTVTEKSLDNCREFFSEDVKEFEGEDKGNLPYSEDSSPVRSDSVEFSTASGKKVAVSESSLNKARKLFSEDMDLQKNSGDLGVSMDGNGMLNISSKSNLTADSLPFDGSTPGSSGFPGFSSASGKKITVSEKSLAHVQKLFTEEVDSLEVEDHQELKTSCRKKSGNLLKPLLKTNLLHSVDSTPVRTDPVGFSTASGKKVAISECSLNKARKLFADDMDLEKNWGDLGVSNACGGKMEISSESAPQTDVPPCEVSTPGRSGFPGFSSASGKKVTVSEKSLAHAQKLFAEEANSLEVEDHQELKTSCRKKSGNLLKPLLKTNLLHSVDSTPVRTDSVGFSTASGKKVAISECSLNKARKLFADDMDVEKNCGDLGVSNASGGEMDISSKSVPWTDFPPCEVSTPGRSGFPGFSSASGKKVTVSEKSLAHAQKIFAEEANSLEVEDHQELKTSCRKKSGNLLKPLLKTNLLHSVDSTPVRSDPVGFSTASGKKVAISECSLNKARKLFADDMDVEKNCGDLGVSNASGGEMDISSKSVPWTDLPPCEVSTPGRSGFPGFSSASGKKVTVSEKSLAHAQKLFAEEASSLEVEDHQDLITSCKKKSGNLLKPLLKTNFLHSDVSTALRSDPVGFSTASGKKVAVSESSLDKAKKLFAEDMDVEKNCGDLGVSNASGGEMDISSKSVPWTDLPPCEVSTPGRSGFPGFSSASGKKVTVSEKSLAHAQKIFAEEANSLEVEDHQELKTSCRKKSGNLLKPLLKTNLLHSVDSTPVRSDPVGFSTASGKKVAISECSLNKARKLFADDMDLEKNCGDLGVSNASGGKMDISSKSIPRTDMLPRESSASGRSGFPGFSSASGKKVTVSEKSLAHAQMLFADEANSLEVEDNIGLATSCRKQSGNFLKPLLKTNVLHSVDSTPVRSDPVGFSTASGKKVAVSESSLNKARKLFSEDMDLKSKCGDLGVSNTSGGKIDTSVKSNPRTDLLPCEVSTPGRSGFPGFSSASGKKVTVSEKSLAHAQKLFAEEANSYEGEDHQDLKTSCRKKSDNLLKPLLKANFLHSADFTPVRTDPVGFFTGSGKKVAVSESSLNMARKLFSEDMSLQDNCGDLGVSKASGVMMDISSKSISRTDLLPCEVSTPGRSGFPGFSSASGKKITVSEKSLAHAQKLFADDVPSLDGSDHGFFSSVNPDYVNTPTQSMPSHVVSSSIDSTPVKPKFLGFSSASGKKVAVSEKSLLNAKKLFSEDFNIMSSSPDHKGDVHVGAQPFHVAQENVTVSQCLEGKDNGSILPLLCESKVLAKENISNASSLQTSVNSNLIGENELKAELPNDLGKQSATSSLSNVKRGTDPGFDLSLSRSEAFLSGHSVQDIKSSCGVKFDDNLTHVDTLECDVFLAESQGDDYIKAVDVTTLNSPMIPIADQNPPSPVFKSSQKGRQKLKRFGIKRKAGSRSASLATPKFDRRNSCSSVSEEFDSKSDSVKSSQSSVVNHEQECSDKVKYSDLWDGDIANETWLGKQLELAEESSLGMKSRQNVDHWAEVRKSQREAISSKGNVKPIIGHCLQLRRGMGPQRRSLRDFVKGKRPGRYSKDQLRKFGVLEEVMNITSTNAADFKFKLQDYYKESIRGDGVLVGEGFRLIPDEKGMFGAIEAQSALLAGPGVDPKLLPAGDWCGNHYRWIIWKLAAYEKSFPQDFGGRCLTAENVMCQLKYRWDREIDCGERSAIRKILEKDDTACKRMILCVSDIKKPALPESSKKMELDLMASSSLLELTDGWYCISGIVDSELAHLIKSRCLTIGTKIVTSGAELVNGPPNGCSPLEPPASAARIRLFANSTRRARWDAKLGYVCSHPGPLPVSLHSLLPGGGAVGVLNDVILARVYPMLTIEKTLDGRRVVRSKRAEAKVAAKYEFERQAWLESVYAEVSAEMQKEMEEEATAMRQKGKRALSDGAVSGKGAKRPRIGNSIYGGLGKSSILSHQGGMVPVEELSRLVDESGDPSEVQKLLTSSQVDMITAYRQESREIFQKELGERVKQKIREEEEKLMSCGKTQDSISAHSVAGRKNRDVVNLLKVRLVDAARPVISKSAVFTIWRPSEDIISLFAKEGSIFKISGVTANGMRSNFIQLSSGKHSRYKVKKSPTLIESSYSHIKREILRRGFDESEFNSLQGSNSPMPPFGEIDLIAMVIRVGEEPNKANGQGFQHVYVAGSDGSLLSIVFWGGIQEFAVEEFLHRGSIVAVLNLQWRRLHGLHRIATAQAVETSSFTLNPTEERLKKAMKEFKLEIEAENELQLIGADFIQSCEQKLDAVLGLECAAVSVSSCLKESTTGGLKSKQSPMAVSPSSENIGYMRPSVAARMKKLQMYEGSPEISLPTCHLRRSASVVKAFHPPRKCSETPTSSNHERKLANIAKEKCQSSQNLDSEGKTIRVSYSENKSCHFPDADSPPMSLDSDPQE